MPSTENSICQVTTSSIVFTTACLVESATHILRVLHWKSVMIGFWLMRKKKTRKAETWYVSTNEESTKVSSMPKLPLTPTIKPTCQVVHCQGDYLFCFWLLTSTSRFYCSHVMVRCFYHHLFLFLASFQRIDFTIRWEPWVYLSDIPEKASASQDCRNREALPPPTLSTHRQEETACPGSWQTNGGKSI